MCNPIPTALPQIEGKIVKAIATLTRERASVLPDLATAHEQGLTDWQPIASAASCSIWLFKN
jgi:tripartite-type tricarboxylate transporter receptor subunit TctC